MKIKMQLIVDDRSHEYDQRRIGSQRIAITSIPMHNKSRIITPICPTS